MTGDDAQTCRLHSHDLAPSDAGPAFVFVQLW
jgi:hypothetical protein